MLHLLPTTGIPAVDPELEKTVCVMFVYRQQCTSLTGTGAGLHADEDMELRLRGGLPRANAVKYVQEKHGVNALVCICAIDRVTFPTLMQYWVPGMDVTGLHELLGNALIMPGEQERPTDLRGRVLPSGKVEDVLKLEDNF